MNAKYCFCSVLFLLAHGVSGVYTERVSVFMMEGDSVTLHTGVQTNQQEDMKWYYDVTRIAQITGDFSSACTDVQCNEGTERFRDRLKLDHQTGSLTITNITNTHSGEYKLKIFSSSRNSYEKIFSVIGHDVPASEHNKMKRKSVMEGESVTLDPGEIKRPNYVMTWYFNDTRIAEMTAEPSMICTDVQSEERFRDRPQLDHQTASLTITNTRNTDSGDYHLDICSSSFNIKRSFSVSVTVPDSGVSSGVIAGICVAVSVAVAAVVIYCQCKVRRKDTRMQQHSDQATDVNDLSQNQNRILMDVASHTSSNHTDAPGMNTNDSSPNRIQPEAASETSMQHESF